MEYVLVKTDVDLILSADYLIFFFSVEMEYRDYSSNFAEG